ncbi:MAG: response regulator [Cytophagaceae bacterium]|nr:response regulator [Cytophagaceae bacterium]
MIKLNTVLLIDDDVVNNFINTILFEKLGICKNIHISKNGQDGLQYIIEKSRKRDQYPDLVLLDINMPVMDGFDFVEKLNDLNLNHQINIVVLTTSTRSKEEEKMKGLGIGRFYRKPLSEEKIKHLMLSLSPKEYPLNG